MTVSADQFDPPGLAAIPVHRVPPPLGFGHHSLGWGEFAATAAGASGLRAAHRRCRTYIGLRIEPAYQRHMPPVPRTEVCQIVAGVAAIAHQDEPALRKPMDEHRHELTGQINRCLVSPTFQDVEFFRTIQGAKRR